MAHRSHTPPPRAGGAAAALTALEVGAPRDKRATGALALVLAVSFMVVLDFSIVNVAIASMERQLHTDAADVQWVITAYAISFGGLLILGGRLGDVWGRRRMLVAGLLVFSVASLAGGLASDIQELIVARAVQGIGAAIVAPAALSLITANTCEGRARNRALGLYGATAAVGFVAGLVLGGVLVQFFDWRAVLWVNVPVGLAAAALAPHLLGHDDGRPGHARLDWIGALLVTGAIAAFVYGLSQGPEAGWISAPTLAGLALSLTLGAGFVLSEERHPVPLIPVSVLRRPSLRSGNLVMVLAGGWVAGELLAIPLFLQLVLHYSPLLTGLAIAPQGIAGFVGATTGARQVRRIGLRAYLVVAGITAGVGLALLGLTLARHDYAFLVIGFVLAGYGTASAVFGSTVAATKCLPDEEQGLAGGLINMSRQAGAAIGVALVAAVIGTGATSATSVGHDSTALGVLAAAAALATGVVAWGIPHRGATAHRLSLPTAIGTGSALGCTGGATASETSGHHRPARSGVGSRPSLHGPRRPQRPDRLTLASGPADRVEAGR